MFLRVPIPAAGILPLILGIFIYGCSPESTDDVRIEVAGPALGTTYRVTIISSPDVMTGEDLKMGVEAVIDGVDGLMSTWKADSELARVNDSESTGWLPVGQALFGVLEHAQNVSDLTDGAFDVTVGPLVDLWGFGAAGPIADLPGDHQVRGALDLVGYADLKLRRDPMSVRKVRPGMRLDLSAIAKGYTVDRVAALLDEHGLDNYLVDIGGELRASGVTEHGQPWRVAIEIPRPSGGVQAVVKLSNMSIATSGDYRNYLVIDGERYSHTINPASGRPVEQELASVSVLAPDAMTADAMATALIVMGPDTAYDFAVQNDIGVYLLKRTDNELAVKMTAKFSQHLEIMD